MSKSWCVLSGRAGLQTRRGPAGEQPEEGRSGSVWTAGAGGPHEEGGGAAGRAGGGGALEAGPDRRHTEPGGG